MNKTRALVLDAMIVTGNTKAAVKAAGGGSSDLWTVPPDQLHYDPRDNVRPLDQARVRHLANLIKANGYDRKKPLGCFVRKVGGEDRIFVYEGQHRFHAALLAIKEGMPADKQIDRLPIVIDDAKSVNRANLIFAGITNNDGEKLTPLELAEKVVELQALGIDNATICARLNITDQTIRDVLLLANAPSTLHKLVRDKVVSSTLAIEEIRTHGAEKAVERIIAAASKAKDTGKAKVTKKHLDKPAAPASQKITEAQAKQLLQALLAVRADAGLMSLTQSTRSIVLDATRDHVDLTAARPSSPAIKPSIVLPHAYDNSGLFHEFERLSMPKPKSRAYPAAEICLAHGGDDTWHYCVNYFFGTQGAQGSPHKNRNARQGRFEAIASAHDELMSIMGSPALKSVKERAAVIRWAETLVEQERTKLAKPAATPRAGIHPASAWPFPTDAEQARLRRTGGAK